MAEDDEAIFVDILPKLDESETDRVTGRLRDKLKEGAKGAGKAIGDVLHSELAENLGRTIGPVAHDMGVQLGKELGTRAGELLHEQISGALKNVGIDFDGVVDKARELADEFGIDTEKVGNFSDAVKDLKVGDKAKAFDDLTKALSGMPGPLGTVADKSKGLVDTYNSLKGNVKDVSGLLTTFEKDAPGIAGALGTVGAAAESMAGPLAAAAAAAMEIDHALHIDSNTFDPGQHGWGHVLFGKIPDWLGITDPSTGLDKHGLPSAPPLADPTKGFQSPVPAKPGVPLGTSPAPPGYTATPGSLDPFSALAPPDMGGSAHTSSAIIGPATHALLADYTTPMPPTSNSPQAVAQYIYQAAIGRGYSSHDATAIVAYSVGESGLNPRISGGVQGDAEVVGLFQEKPGFARAGGVDPSARYSVEGNTTAYLNQLERHRGSGDIYDQLLATSVGGPMYTGGRGYMDQLMGRARGYLAGVGAPAAGGGGFSASPAGFGVGPGAPGMPMPAPGLVAPPTMPNMGGGGSKGPVAQQSIGHGSGVGVTGGGALGMAEQAGVMAAAMFGFGGGGMAAQIGMQEMNLAIQKGGQMAATAAMAIPETFMLSGGQMGAPSVGQGGWIRKILGGLMGQQFNAPNIAGGSQPAKQPKQKEGEGEGEQDPLKGGKGGPKGGKPGPSGHADDPIHVQQVNPPDAQPQGQATSAMNAAGVMSAVTA